MNFNERINMEKSGTIVPCKKCLGTKNIVKYINTNVSNGKHTMILNLIIVDGVIQMEKWTGLSNLWEKIL